MNTENDNKILRSRGRPRRLDRQHIINKWHAYLQLCSASSTKSTQSGFCDLNGELKLIPRTLRRILSGAIEMDEISNTSKLSDCTNGQDQTKHEGINHRYEDEKQIDWKSKLDFEIARLLSASRNEHDIAYNVQSAVHNALGESTIEVSTNELEIHLKANAQKHSTQIRQVGNRKVTEEDFVGLGLRGFLRIKR